MRHTKKICTALIAVFVLTVQVYGQIIRTITDPKSINSFSVTNDGKIISIGVKETIKIFNSETGIMITSISNGQDLKSMAIDPDGVLLATSSSSWGLVKLKLWSIGLGKAIELKHTHTDDINSICFNHNSTIIATGSSDKSIKLFDAKTFAELVTLKGHKKKVTEVKFSPDDRFLLSGSEDGTMKLWDLSKNIELLTYGCGKDEVMSVCFSPDGNYVAAGCTNGAVKLFMLEKPNDAPVVFKMQKGYVNAVSFTPDGRFLASGSSDKTFVVYDWSNKTMVTLRLGAGVNHTKAIMDLAFSKDGRMFTRSDDQKVKIWSWGFPILSVSDLVVDDANGNQKIEGTETASVKFTLKNDGYGEALKVNLLFSDKNHVKGLNFKNDVFVGDLPPKSEKVITIPIQASNELRDSISLFQVTNVSTISYQPLKSNDLEKTINTVAIPILTIVSPVFEDSDGDFVLKGRESGKIKFTLKNTGAGVARTLKASISSSVKDGVAFNEEQYIGNINQNESQDIEVPLTGLKNCPDGMAVFTIVVADNNGITEEKFEVKVKTSPYKPTLKEEIKDFVEAGVNAWQQKGKYERTEDFKVRVTEELRKKQIELLTQKAIDSLAQANMKWDLAVSEYDADHESFKITLPRFEPFYVKVSLSKAQEFDKRFRALQSTNARYTVVENQLVFLHLNLVDPLDEKVNFAYDSKEMIAFNATQLDLNFGAIDVDIPQGDIVLNSGKTQTNIVRVGKSDVDLNIPQNDGIAQNTYALIIGNEEYSAYQTGLNSEVNVEYATNDAKIFKEYVTKTLGVPEENVTLKTNATLGQMKQSIIKLAKLAELSNGKAEIIVYYSGHGLPDEETKEGYIMPVDISGTEIKSAIKISDLYTQLTQFPTQKVTIILDACFSGGARNAPLIAMKGVKIKPKDDVLKGNIVVLASCTGEESSSVYREKQHGLFTYFMLKKLQETKGNVDYKTLMDEVGEKVKLQSVLINNKTQTPQALVSSDIQGGMSYLKFYDKK